MAGGRMRGLPAESRKLICPLSSDFWYSTLRLEKLQAARQGRFRGKEWKSVETAGKVA